MKRTKLIPLCLLGVMACSDETQPEPTESAFEAIEVTRFELGRQPDPAVLNERIPITVGITASSAVAGEVPTESVPVVVSFVDPENPEDRACSSNGLLFEVVGDGVEHEYTGFIWPSTFCSGLVGETVTIQVELMSADGEDLLQDPLVLSQANANEPANASCRGPEAGCVNEFRLELAPEDGNGQNQVDIEFAAFGSESSVGVIPAPIEPGFEDEQSPQPIVVTRNLLVLNGRDPYRAPVDTDALSEELLAAAPGIEEDLRFGLSPDEVETLDDLPGTLRMTYEISAAADGEVWMPLSIGQDSGYVGEATITELLPGTANVIAHEVFLDGAAYDAVLDPDLWLGEEAFVVRSCMTTDFPQFRGVAGEAECRTLDVLLVPPTEVESGASSVGFNRTKEYTFGNDRIKLLAKFETTNNVGPNGVFSDTLGRMSVKGKIGKTFDLELARAVAKIDAPLVGERSFDLSLRFAGNDLFTRSREGTSISFSESMEANVSRTIVRAVFMFGPVPVSFDLKVGGTVAAEAEASATFLQGEAACRPHLPLPTGEVIQAREDLLERIATHNAYINSLDLPNFQKKLLRAALVGPLLIRLGDEDFDFGDGVLSECIVLEGNITPSLNLDAAAFGGIDVFVAQAGIQLDLIIAKTELPLTTTLALGRNDLDQLVAAARTQLELLFTPLDGDLKLVGRLGPPCCNVSASVSIVSFAVATIETTLLSGTTGAAKVLSL